jgi:hypothetical protein
MKRLAAALLLLAGCVDDFCPLISYIDAFQLVLSSERWPAGRYKVVVSFQDEYGAASFQCEAQIPALPALDAGVLLPDAGVDARGRFACTPTPGASTWRRAQAQAGQELVLDLEGTPTTVHVTVTEAERPVLEQDVALNYQLVRPYGDECPGPRRAAARIELPQ